MAIFRTNIPASVPVHLMALPLVSQIIKVISTVLEGEAGILWALVLLVLVLVFLQQY